MGGPSQVLRGPYSGKQIQLNKLIQQFFVIEYTRIIVDVDYKRI